MKNIRIASLAVAALSATAVLNAQTGSAAATGCMGPNIVGVWLTKSGPPGQLFPSGPQMFTKDGSVIGIASTAAAPGPPAAVALGDTQGASIGQWEHISPNKFRIVIINPIYKNGAVNGFFRVRSIITLSDTGQQFNSDSVAQVEWLDVNLNVVFSATGQGIGTRLESPSGCLQ